MTLPDGRTAGVFRQGPTADRTSISDRVRRLMNPEQSRPRAMLALMPDETRLRQTQRLLARYPGPVYLPLENNVSGILANDRVWQAASVPNPLSIREILAHLRPGGRLPWEPPTARLRLPGDTELRRVDDGVTDHLLPVMLKPTEKRVLDCLSNWPLITAADMGAILGLSPSRVSRSTVHLKELGLLSAMLLEGQRRLALSDRGQSLIARRDRVSVGAAHRRWSVEPVDGRSPTSWQDVPGGRSRPLARTVEHTQAVQYFLAALIIQTKRTPGFAVSQLSPPHHATRYFWYGGSLRSIQPDAFGIVRVNRRDRPFFLEWERRALNPSTMSARLAPYLRYYSSNRPLVLIAFEDSMAGANFLAITRSETERTNVKLPLWVSSKEALEQAGPLGRAWRSPEALEPARVFR